MGKPRSVVRGSSGLGWLVAEERDRWMVWLEDGAHALLSVERVPDGTRVIVELVRPGFLPFVAVNVPGSSPDLDLALLEQVVEAAVAGVLPLEPAYRPAWAIAIRTTAEQLRARHADAARP